MGAWILVGMMGAGKSSVGRKLAELSDRPFVDTDFLIQERFLRPVAQIFRVYGEDAFRDHETSVLASLTDAPIVLSTGGGIVGREENWAHMRRIGRTIYLKSSPETLIGRLAESKKRRPLLETEDWQESVRQILARREPLYDRAEIHISLDEIAIEDAAQAILALLKGESGAEPTTREAQER